MKSFLRLLFYSLLNIAYFLFMAWIIYAVWTHKIPFYWIFLFLALFFRLPSVVTAYSRYLVEDDRYTLDLTIRTNIPSSVTHDFIVEILHQENVINTIRNDLRKTGLIGYKEEWRLGLIPPDQDIYGLSLAQPSTQASLKKGPFDPDFSSYFVDKIRLKRTAVLHSVDYFKDNNISVTNGAVKPLGKSKWTYGLDTKLNKGEFINIRNIQMEDDSSFSEHRAGSLPGFLREDGFPLKDNYPDGDPLSTDRGGTIVIDKDRTIIIYPRYFTQRRLIDDDGNLVNLGIDENLDRASTFEVDMRPSVSRLLIQRISAKGYTPVLRYRSFPYASDLMLPILDTPMSASGWADLFIDTRGKARLFISKEKTEDEWYEMMAKLKRLFYAELAKKDNHLLGLTKDQAHLNAYLVKKLEILKEYFIIQDWQLP